MILTKDISVTNNDCIFGPDMAKILASTYSNAPQFRITADAFLKSCIHAKHLAALIKEIRVHEVSTNLSMKKSLLSL